MPHDQDLLVWAAALATVALLFLPYLASFRRHRRLDHERKLEASRLGIDRPLAQYPHIDPALCIGCGACVRACPEGDVLGIVGGVAVVINGLRCVGHGDCADACPVAAIEVGLGDLKARTDVPQLTADLQTSVAGIYVAGELSGLSLVRNAVEQGRRAVEAIARDLGGRRAGEGTFDVAVIGAGPAGIAAALRARELGLSSVVLEREATLGGSLLHYPRRKMVLTQPVALPPWGDLGREEYSKEQLLAIFTEASERSGLDVRFGQDLIAATHEEAGFELRTARETFRARAVVLAIGRRGTPRQLGVPGEERSKVMYRLQDAASYERQRILVVGGGDSAVEAAVGLAREGQNEVALSYRRDRLLRVKRKNQDAFEQLTRQGCLRPLLGSEVVRIDEDAVELKTSDGAALRLPNDYVFVLIGGVPPFELLQRLEIRLGGDAGPRQPTTANAGERA